MSDYIKMPGYGIYSKDDEAPGATGPSRLFGRVLLNGPEKCLKCKKTFLSLYPIQNCKDHEGKEQI